MDRLPSGDKLLSGRRMLVVEDEILVLMMIEDMLGDLGCQSVTSAATIEKAIALIEAQTFDAVMLDMNLDGDTATPWAKRLPSEACPSSIRLATAVATCGKASATVRSFASRSALMN
jgi:CheY-like chemotaxis protein